MSALAERILERAGAAAEPLSSGFAPVTVRPPERFLKGFAAARAGLRNPVELWDRDLFSMPCRPMRRFGRRFVEIADPALMHQVLVAEAHSFTRSAFQLRFTRPLVGNGILAATGENWKTQRRAAAPCFRQQALDDLAPAAARAGARAARRLANHAGASDVMAVMMGATFDVVTELIGIKAGALNSVVIEEAGDAYLRGVGLSALADIFGLGWLHRRLPLRGNRAIESMRQEVSRSFAARDVNPAGLLARLESAFATRGPARDIDLRDSLIAFIAAGHETAAVALTWALYLIAQDPIVQRRLREEAHCVLGDGGLHVDRLEQLHLHLWVLKEAMRLFPPIALMQRTATRPVTIGGVQLAPGDEAVCAIYVMHRSPRLWRDPEVFDPDRFSDDASRGRHRFAFLPFGAGQHACLGMPLAYMEMLAILAEITRRLALTPDRSQQVRPVMRLTLRPQDGVRLFAAPISQAPRESAA